MDIDVEDISMDGDAVDGEWSEDSFPTPNAPLDLLSLPHDYLELLILHHAPPTSLAALRASCRQLKSLADARITCLRVPHADIQLHSFWRTCALASVQSLDLELPGSGTSGGHTAAAASAFANGGDNLAAAPPPLRTLLPPLALAGLRRHLPGLRHLTISNVHFPPSTAPSPALPAAAAVGAGVAAPPPHPLDLSGLASVCLHGLPPPDGNPWRGRRVNPFPGGLGPSLAAAAASLTCLRLSYMTFEGSEGDLLGCLTGLRELSLVCCNNHTAAGLTRLSALTRLSCLEYADVHYKVGIPNEMVGLSALTQLQRVNFRRSDFYGHEVAAWSAWGPSLTRLEMSSQWETTLDAVPPLLPALTSLSELDLPCHLLDSDMWHLLAAHLPRLAAARFAWLDLGVEVPEVRPIETEVPHRGLRRLRLDGPPDVRCGCDRPLLPLLPALEELRIGEDEAALGAIAEDFPHVYNELERWLHMGVLLRHSAGEPSAAAPLRLLCVPYTWLDVLLPAGPRVRNVRVLQLLHRPARAGPAPLRAGAYPAGAAAAALVLGVWSDPAAWACLRELQVPRDVDAAALAPGCRRVRHLTVTQSYGDALLALAAAPELLPELTEVTLAGAEAVYGNGGGAAAATARGNGRAAVAGGGGTWRDAESYHAALLAALAARGVRVVRVTRGSVVSPPWWARVRAGVDAELEGGTYCNAVYVQRWNERLGGLEVEEARRRA